MGKISRFIHDLTVVPCHSHASTSLLHCASNQTDAHRHHHLVYKYLSSHVCCHGDTDQTQFKTAGGAKGAVDQKNGRRFSTGHVSNGRPTVNYSYVSTNTPARAVGVQRKLELDHKVDVGAFLLHTFSSCHFNYSINSILCCRPQRVTTN
jgi:hypothetical protein